jgi:hypothetical protein
MERQRITFDELIDQRLSQVIDWMNIERFSYVENLGFSNDCGNSWTYSSKND